MFNSVLFLLFIIILKCSEAQITKPLKFRSTTTKEGQVYPSKIEIATGEHAVFQLLTLPANFDKCILTNPTLAESFTIKPGVSSGRIEYWNPGGHLTGCGVRVKAITVKDAGLWKLEARNQQNKAFYSFINITVLERDQKSPVFYLEEGEPAMLDINPNSDYCDIKKLASVRANTIYDKCQVKLDPVQRSLAGTWPIQSGVIGQVKEVRYNARVIISKEEFIVGVNYTNNRINLYCNLQNTKNINFRYCRFVRGDGKVALRLLEGLSDGKYSYFGNGLSHGDCGLTIDRPETTDLTVWKCQLGIVDANAMMTSRDSVVYVPRDRMKRDYEKEVDSNLTVLSGVGDSLELKCQAQYRLKYCWFRHPNNTVFNADRFHDAKIWHPIGDLDAGVCGISIVNGTKNDTGIWSCHMSEFGKVGMDEVLKINVRVSDTPLVAVENVIITSLNKEVSIKCQVTSNSKSLDYCRFSVPNGDSFSLNEGITEDKALGGVYWYNGTGLVDGDCQVTINKLTKEHIGKWNCAGKLTDSDTIELYDIITVRMNENTAEGSFSLTTTQIVGIVIGSVAALIILGSILYFIRRRKTGSKFHATPARGSTASESSETPNETRSIPNPTLDVASSSENIEMSVIAEELQERASLHSHQSRF